MTFQEFKNQIYYTKFFIVIPSLDRLKINRNKFKKRNKLDQKQLDIYLEKLYNKQYNFK